MTKSTRVTNFTCILMLLFGLVSIVFGGEQCHAQTPPNRAQEQFPVATANVALSTGYTAFGGTYILSQLCTAYGTLDLQTLSAKNTWLTLSSKSASDTTVGTSVTLAGQTQVRVNLTGTTACDATLTRVPQ